MSDWIEINNRLQKKFQFEDFKQAFSFMTHVAMLAEKQNHHPEWTNIWNEVFISLSTHDPDNTITSKDRKLAKEIDQINKFYLKKKVKT